MFLLDNREESRIFAFHTLAKVLQVARSAFAEKVNFT